MIGIVSPFPFHALPKLWRWIEAARDRIADDYFPKTLDDFITQWEQFREAGRRSWAVYSDAELCGVFVVSRTSPLCCDAHCIFARRFWGRTVTVTASHMLANELFSDTPNNRYEKVSTMAFADNKSLGALIKALGGSREGLLRNHTRRGGKFVDVMILSLERERYVSGIQQQLGIEPKRSKFDHQPAISDQHNGNEHRNGHDHGNGKRNNGAGSISGATAGAVSNRQNDPADDERPQGISGAGAESGTRER